MMTAEIFFNIFGTFIIIAFVGIPVMYHFFDGR